MRAAAWLGDADAVADAMATLADSRGRVPAVLRREGRAAQAALEGRRSEALGLFLDARRRWQELGLGFESAMSALSLVTMLGAADPQARAAADEAAATFERLGARPLSAQLERAVQGGPAVAAVRGEAVGERAASVRSPDRGG